MRAKILSVAAVFAAAGALTACGSSSTTATSSSPAAAAPSATSAMATLAARSGAFEGLNDKHVAGTATVSGTEVSLMNFSSDEGPDLHIYLTTGTDESAVTAGKELAPVAFDKTTQEFALNGIDAAKYDTVVIHCDKAKAVFGAAKLA